MILIRVVGSRPHPAPEFSKFGTSSPLIIGDNGPKINKLEPDYQAGQRLLSAIACKLKRKRQLDFLNSDIKKNGGSH